MLGENLRAPEMIRIAPEAALLVFGTLMLVVATWSRTAWLAAFRQRCVGSVAIAANPTESGGAA
jgi:hypothetical protein